MVRLGRHHRLGGWTYAPTGTVIRPLIAWTKARRGGLVQPGLTSTWPCRQTVEVLGRHTDLEVGGPITHCRPSPWMPRYPAPERAPNYEIGIEPTASILVEWVRLLESKDVADVLSALTFLGGRHISERDRNFSLEPHASRYADLFQQLEGSTRIHDMSLSPSTRSPDVKFGDIHSRHHHACGQSRCCWSRSSHAIGDFRGVSRSRWSQVLSASIARSSRETGAVVVAQEYRRDNQHPQTI
jgi:hypothetical protein